MTCYLLDANVLIAMVIADHEHHVTATDWLTEVEHFAICPVVEGALVRFLLRIGESSSTAQTILRGVRDSPQCKFWGEDMSYADIDLARVVGHRQVTDAYLAALAAHRGGQLATLDTGLAAAHPHAATLIT